MKQKQYSGLIRFFALFHFVLLATSFSVNAQTNDPRQEVFKIVERMPAFPGGKDSLTSYLKTKLQYPAAAKEAGIKGTVVVQFIIGREGKITDAKVVKGLDPSCDQEALRLVEAMPNWTPGMQNGSPIRVQFNLPVRFEIPE